MPAELQDLPVELLYDVQLYALSEHLPLSSKFLRSVYANTTTHFRALYLFGRSLRGSHLQPPSNLFTKALCYPVCSQDVLEALCNLVQKHQASLGDSDDPVPDILNPNHVSRFARPDLPRRLFRHLTPKTQPWERWLPNDEPLPFLRRLFETPPDGMGTPLANSHDGYALTKAVHAGFVPLVQFLLANGASPRAKDGLAVMVAIRRRDLPLVRMLLERSSCPGEVAGSSSTASTDTPVGQISARKCHSRFRVGGAGRGGEPARGAKRRRLEDRMEASPAMLKAAIKCGARDIADYLMKEKGCVPDMQTLKLMTR